MNYVNCACFKNYQFISIVAITFYKNYTKEAVAEGNFIKKCNFYYTKCRYPPLGSVCRLYFCILKFLPIYTDLNCNFYCHWQNHGNKINYSKIDIHGVILFHFHPWAQSSFTLKITNSSVWEFGSLFPEISVFHMPKQREIFVQNGLLNKTKISCQYLFQKSFLLFQLWDEQF